MIGSKEHSSELIIYDINIKSLFSLSWNPNNNRKIGLIVNEKIGMNRK